jgi:ribonuclease E
MLINYVPGEECRIAIVEDGRLEELYHERASSESHVGNIYKGKVVNVEPSIQAAFIDFGLERNGFLHISDLHPKYFPGQHKEELERVGEKTPRRDRPPIQRCLRRGQEILVQVLKEGIGTKGPTLTSYLSIPSRFLVMMSDMEKLGVSRKLEDDEARRRLRDVIAKLKAPAGFGIIGRTAASEQSEAVLKRDLAYLKRVWKQIDKRAKEVRVGELFAESDLVIRTIRDVYSADIERIIVDNASAARRAMDFLTISNPRSGANVLVYRGGVPLFHRYDLERQIENINARTVPLPSGGSLVIDSTEALVAIDVNSGKMRDNRDAETTAYKTNLEATDEICRQLRLRDLGGVIVNDLIDMRNLKHRRDIEQRFRNNLKNDRARTRIGPISQFGILEMTRQRMRPSLKNSIYVACDHCKGSGHSKSAESVVLDVMRRLALAVSFEPVTRIELTVSPDVAFQLLNRRRAQLVDLEQRRGTPVMVRVNAGGPIDFVSLDCYDSRGGLVPAETRGADNHANWSADLIDVETLRQQEREAGILTDEPVEPMDEEVEDETSSEDGVAKPAGKPESGDEAQPQPEPRRGRRRRGRRGGRGGEATQPQPEAAAAQEAQPSADALPVEREQEPDQQPLFADHDDEAPAPAPGDQPEQERAPQPESTPVAGDAGKPKVPVVWRSRQDVTPEAMEDEPAEPQPETHESAPLARIARAEARAREAGLPTDAGMEEGGDGPRRRRRRRGGRRRRRGGQGGQGGQSSGQTQGQGQGPGHSGGSHAPAAPPRRPDQDPAGSMDDYEDHEPGDVNGNMVEPMDEGENEGDDAGPVEAQDQPQGSGQPQGQGQGGRRRRRRRRGGRGRNRNRGGGGGGNGGGGNQG